MVEPPFEVGAVKETVAVVVPVAVAVPIVGAPDGVKSGTQVFVFPLSPALFNVVWVKLVPQYVYCVSDMVKLKALPPRVVTESGIVSDVSNVAL